MHKQQLPILQCKMEADAANRVHMNISHESHSKCQDMGPSEGSIFAKIKKKRI